MISSLSCIFPSDDIRKTADYYDKKLGFRQVAYLESTPPHICLYRDSIEIILTQTQGCKVVPNHERYGYGYDAYFYTREQESLQNEFKEHAVKIIRPLCVTDYGNKEFVIEDIDGRWLGFGLKEY